MLTDTDQAPDTAARVFAPPGHRLRKIVPPDSRYRRKPAFVPAHRDRLAFMRIVSGAFEKGMEVWHSGTNKTVALKQPQQFMADEREAVERQLDVLSPEPGAPVCVMLGASLIEGHSILVARLRGGLLLGVVLGEGTGAALAAWRGVLA